MVEGFWHGVFLPKGRHFSSHYEITFILTRNIDIEMPLGKQLIRYAIVGVTSNVIIFLLYLLMTWIGISHIIAMTALYILGLFQSFILNKSWSFHYGGSLTPALFRYAIAYALGYVINLLALLILVDQVGYPHQWVQGIMIMLVAAMLFLAQIYWVFPSQPRGKVA